MYRAAGNVLRRAWLVLAVLIIVYAVLVVLGRELLPVINRFQPRIDAFLSNSLGLDIETGYYTGQWRAMRPAIGVRKLSIAGDDGEAIAIEQVDAEVNLLGSLAEFNPVWDALTVGGARASVIEDADGRWSVGGFALGGERDLGFVADMLFDSRFIAVERIELDVHFYSGSRTTVHISDIRMENDGDFRRLRARIGYGDGNGPAAQLIIEGRGDPRDGFAGRGHVRFSRLNFDTTVLSLVRRWFPVQAEQIGEIDTDLDLALWFDISDYSLLNVRGTLAADEIPLNWIADAPPLRYLRANVTGWYRQGEDWGLQLQSLETDWDGESIDPLDLSLRQGVGDGWGQMQLAVDHLNLDFLTRVLDRTDLLGERADAILSELSPGGRLHNVHLDLTLDGERPDFRLRADLDRLSVESWKNAPAARGVSGYVEAGLRQGFVEVDSPSGFAMHYPQAYDDFMPFGAVRGRVDWHWLPDQQRVTVTSGAIAIDGEEGRGNAYLALDLPVVRDAFEPEMTLMVSLRDSHSRLMERYLPRVLPDDLRQWLDRAVGDAKVPEAGFLWRGSLRKANREGRTIQLYVAVEDGRLDYQQGWPALEDFAASLVVADGRLDAHATTGRLGEGSLQSLEARLRPRRGGQLLTLDGKVTAASGHALDVLASSPLGDRLGDFRDWRLDGDSAITLALAIPLAGSGAEPRYDVTAALSKGTLALPETALRFTDIGGEVGFSLGRGLYAEQVRGRFLGNPLAAGIATDDGTTRVSLQGTLGADSLAPYLGVFAPRLQGETDIAGVLTVPARGSGEQPKLTLNSSTSGLAVALPEPFAKAAESSWPLAAELIFQQGLTTVRGAIEDRLTARWTLRDGRFERGHLRLGGDEAPLPQTASLLISGHLGAVDWADWQPVLAPESDAAAGAGAGAVTWSPQLQLDFGRLRVAGFELGSTLLTGDRGDGGDWHLQLMSDRLRGDVHVPGGDNGLLTLDLEYLRLPALASADGEPGLGNLSPLDIPAFAFATRSLVLGDDDFGDLAFRAVKQRGGILFDDIRGTLKGLRIGPADAENADAANTASLGWLERDGRQHSHFSGTLTGRSLGQLLESWGYPRALDARRGAFFADLQWPGKPWRFEAAEFEGYLGIDLSDGQFYQVTGTGANTFFKLVSLFNFDTWLRRLRFDFSDLFSGGMSFDTVKGGLAFDKGTVAFDDPIAVTMPSGKIRLLGSADLERELLDARLVATLPVGTNLPWVAALLGGLPAAAGVYLTGKLLERQVDQLSSISYTVTGPWGDPEVAVDRIFSDKLE